MEFGIIHENSSVKSITLQISESFPWEENWRSPANPVTFRISVQVIFVEALAHWLQIENWLHVSITDQ